MTIKASSYVNYIKYHTSNACSAIFHVCMECYKKSVVILQTITNDICLKTTKKQCGCFPTTQCEAFENH